MTEPTGDGEQALAGAVDEATAGRGTARPSGRSGRGRRADADYRIEVTIECPRGHKLIRFSRSTLPEYLDQHEVFPDMDRKWGKFVSVGGLDARGRGAMEARVRLLCETPLPTGGRCGSDVQIRVERLEEYVESLWAPYRILRLRWRWDDAPAPRAIWELRDGRWWNTRWWTETGGYTRPAGSRSDD